MLKHIAMWKFMEEVCGKTKSENMRFVKQSLMFLKGKIPKLTAIEADADVLASPAGYAFALICAFFGIPMRCLPIR